MPTDHDSYVTTLLANVAEGKHVLTFEKKESVFSQGDPATAIYFIETGRVKISVVSSGGKEGVLAMMGPNDFIGEGCLVGHSFRMNTATTLEATTVYQVEKRSMLRALREQPDLSETFMASLLARTRSIEANICDQLFNQSETRLARVLLKMSTEESTIPRVSHETLSEMVGTTRSRVTLFMNKFKAMGLIDYDEHGKLTVKTDRLSKIVD